VIASGDGHVINTSSLNGFFAQGKLSAYVTSKFAVRGFTETLRAEMLAARTPVKVSVVHPGGINTPISHNALANAERLGIEVTAADRDRAKLYSDKYLKMDVDQAARVIVDGVQRGRPRILVGNDAKVVDVLVRLAPSQAPRLAVAFERLTDRAAR
jgi:short-subunit dehydrogenase